MKLYLVAPAGIIDIGDQTITGTRDRARAADFVEEAGGTLYRLDVPRGAKCTPGDEPGSFTIANPSTQGVTARALRTVQAERRQNPGRASSTTHAVPAKVAALGRALDLVYEHEGRRARLSLRGCLLLAPPDAFERGPGRGRLYIVRGRLADARPPSGAEKGTDAYRRWHKRAADLVGYVDTPPPADRILGRGVRIGYASDKWTTAGSFVDYEHDFDPPGPLVYSTGEERPRALVLVGGAFTVTTRGIVD